MLDDMYTRYFGAEVKEEEQEKKDLERLIDDHLTLASKFVISDFVPWLSFIPRLQGHTSALQEFSNFRKGVTDRMFEVEKHRERAKERQHLHQQDLTNYVQDFVDLLLASHQDGGEPLSDQELVPLLTVTICHISSFFFGMLLFLFFFVRVCDCYLERVTRSMT